MHELWMLTTFETPALQAEELARRAEFARLVVAGQPRSRPGLIRLATRTLGLAGAGLAARLGL